MSLAPPVAGHGFASHVAAHKRLLIAAIAGVVVGAAWPDIEMALSRALLGWNVFVWIYLAWVVVTIYRAEEGHVQKVAQAQAESASIVLAVVIVASIVSLAAVMLEIRAAKAAGADHMLPHVLFALATVVGSWLLLPTLFGLSYAGLLYASKPGGGLLFPGETKKFEPDYIDLLYFSFTIAVASQTSDVVITTREMRRLVIVQSILSFAFNTTVLAFSINAAASLF